MSPANAKTVHVVERIESHKAAIRFGQLMLFFSMTALDAYYGPRFDFPGVCYVILVGAILGLDIKKLTKILIKKYK